MLLFHHLVFDDMIEVGATNFYTDPKFNEELSTADKLAIIAVATQVAGTTPTLTVQLEHSGDNRNFIAKNGTAEISGQP